MANRSKMKINLLTPIRGGGPYNWGRDLVSEINKGGFSAEHIHGLPELLASPFYQKADIVHTTVPLAYKFWKKPVVFTVCAEYTCEKNIWRFFTPRAIKQADIVTTRSHFLKERLNLKDAIVIPNAIFPEEFGEVKHLEKDTINLVTVTNFYFQEKAKGILNILEILKRAAKEAGKQIKYSVIGGGPYLKQVMETPRPENVNLQFLDMLPSPKEVLERSDIFLYYSHQDNFPIAILEAMSCGLPVITNNVGAVGEIIETGQSGFIASDDEFYLDCLLKLMRNPDLRTKVARNSREAVETKFNWAKVIDKYLDIYCKLI